MENISNKIAYLKGLMEGLKFDEKSNEGKVFRAMLEIFDEINETFEDVYDYQDELAEQVDMIDEDLAELEDEFADLDECDCCDCGYAPTEEDMVKVRNLGRKSLDEVIGKLQALGQSFAKRED